MKIAEILNRTEQLKAALDKALVSAAEKYPDLDVNTVHVRKELLDNFRALTKTELTAVLTKHNVGQQGVATASEVSQFILSQMQKLDR